MTDSVHVVLRSLSDCPGLVDQLDVLLVSQVGITPYYGPERVERGHAGVAVGVGGQDYPISADDARTMGLQVSTDLPAYYYTLMDLYRQPTRRSPTVEYVPRRLSEK